MDIHQTASSLREELRTDLDRGLTSLTELASRYANNRELLYRAVLLKREVAHGEEEPAPEHTDAALALLDALVADQNVVPGTPTRHEQAEAARSRALEIEIPKGIAVECMRLRKSYRRTKFALEDVSLNLRFGEILGVVGRNGNGKTTLFRLVVGELKADGGDLSFPAIQSRPGPVRWSDVRQQLAYVPQDLPPWHGSLRGSLHYEAAVHDIRGAENEREVDFIIERLGLNEELDKRWHELSGGFKLRFALARALVWKPKLLILDEPLANLDFLTQQVVLSDLRHLTDSMRYPLAVMISSQHLHEIEAVSDKLLLLTKGRQRFFGTTDEIGADRTVNRFELDGHFDAAMLRQLFSGSSFLSVYYNGVAFVLTTKLDMTAADVVRRTFDARLPLTYFRDISRSAKSLLQDEADAN
jgi:ABC-2 type transport system ATP-binding protein